MFRTFLKIISRALLVFLATGCSQEELYKVDVYEYTDLKISINSTEKDEDGLPITTLKNFACFPNMVEQTVGDTIVSIRQSSGCYKKLVDPSPILRTSLDRISLYSNRSFGPDYPKGTSLNTFLYYNYNATGFPKPIEEWNNTSVKGKYLPGLVLINAPDTLKGLTLFVWNLRTRNGQELVDSSWFVLK